MTDQLQASKPNPGSKAAIEQGCRCPRMDNRNGEGFVLYGERVWWISELCAMHNVPSEKR